MQISKRFVKLGTGTDEISGSDLSADFAVPSNYTPTSADITGHLTGIDNELGTITSVNGDISHSSFSLTNNQTSFTNVTGLLFANGVTRSANVEYSIFIDATSDLYEAGQMKLIQRGADWQLSRFGIVGDNSLVDFDVNTSGQIQYKTANYSGFISGTLKFRAITTQV